MLHLDPLIKRSDHRPQCLKLSCQHSPAGQR
jgi:hypothetical protein